MKTAIVYHSAHHGNTKKVLDAIAQQGAVTLIKADTAHIDLSAYDLIGFASGIYFFNFHERVLQCAEKNLPHGKKVFLLYTCGVKLKRYTNAIKGIAAAKGAKLLGAYGCRGFDTFGWFGRIGGIAKGRPNEADIAGAVKFFAEISPGSGQ
ncbi:MAG: flavodoxin family protein [Treponema sp.]|jgi:flavodoxin|nr:flavodoxin family protein [Treponema sp.]